MVLQIWVHGRVALKLRRHSLLLLLLDLLGGGQCRLSQAPTKVVQIIEQHVELLLQRSHMRRHILVLLRIFEATTAIERIDALEVQVPAALARRLAVALDFAALALVTTSRRQYVLFSGCMREKGMPTMRARYFSTGATCCWRFGSHLWPFSCCRGHRQGCRRTAGEGAAAVRVVRSDFSRPTQWRRVHASSP
jgi:hypothetical protein